LISSIAATLAGAITWIASIARWGMIFGGMRGEREDRADVEPGRRADGGEDDEGEEERGEGLEEIARPQDSPLEPPSQAPPPDGDRGPTADELRGEPDGT